MSENPLKIVGLATPPKKMTPSLNSRATRREKAKAKMEHLWLTDPEQFNPSRNCMERERVERTWNLIKQNLVLKNQDAVDLGCGYGLLSLRLLESQAQVLAIDLIPEALSITEKNTQCGVKTSQDYIPNTKINDDTFDLVLSTDVIAYLSKEDYRLYFAELSRLVKPSGSVVCSTPIDIYSEDALQRFASLAESEFEINNWVFSYHRLYISLCHFIGAPSRFVRAHKDPEYKVTQLNQIKGLMHWWYRVNTHFPCSLLWKGVQLFTNPLYRFLKQNRFCLLKLEAISQFIWAEAGISHAIFLGKRRPMIPHPSSEETPIEPKHKKLVWE